MVRLRDCSFILLCCVPLYFSNFIQRPLLKPSEGRVARVAQEMLDSGDWMVPHLNGAVRLEKPPFSSWPVALIGEYSNAGQVLSWHAYIPPGSAAIALVLLVYLWISGVGRAVGSPERFGESPHIANAGMLGAFVLAAAPGFILQARSAEMDMLLALFVAAAFWGFWKHRAGGSIPALMVGYAALGLAVLTKAHVGLAMVVPALAIWNLLERGRHALPLNASGVWRWHALGALLAAAIVLPSAVPFVQGSGITWEDFTKQGLDRFKSASGHKENPAWYLYQVPGWFMPWFLLLPLGLWQTWDLPPDERAPLRRLCWAWLGWSLLLFSLLTSKQRHYAIPFFPPLAMLIGDTVARWLNHPDAPARRRARVCLAGLALMLALLSLGLPALIKEFLPLYLVLLAAAIFGLCAWITLYKRPCLHMAWAGCVCLALIFGQTLERSEGLRESAEPLCRAVRALVPADAELYDVNVVFAANPARTCRADVLFYLGRTVRRAERPLAEVLALPKEKTFVLVTRKARDTVAEKDYEVMASENRFGGHDQDVFLIRAK